MDQVESCNTDREMTLEEKCNHLRKVLKDYESLTRKTMGDNRFRLAEKFPSQHAEMKANIMLTVRHLEDARMRLGKVLQYAGDGVSILDK